MIDEAIKPNDILRVVAVHDSLSGREAFRHSHWARPSARRRRQEQCYPDCGTLNMFSHGLSRSSVAGSIIEVIDIGDRAARVHRFRFCRLRCAPSGGSTERLDSAALDRPGGWNDERFFGSVLKNSRLLIGIRSQCKQCLRQLFEI
jgi:hypothetical protein